MSVFAGGTDNPVTKPAKVELPQNKTVSISSPDGRWNLVATPFNVADPTADRKLFLANRRTGERNLVKSYGRDLSVGWGPDSRAFFLNDAFASNVEDAYIYQIGGEQPFKLNDRVLGSDPEARALGADHTYFHAWRWLNTHSVEVEYCGHRSSYPARQFHFLYRVDWRGDDAADAEVHRLSKSVQPASLTAPECLHD